MLTEAANFSTVAAQYHLISSQTLDTVAKGINKISGSQLGYEGTQQYMRDVQVFRQLKVDAYCKSGAFENARNARSYIENASNGQRDTLIKKLNGTGQEVDWLRWKQVQLNSLAEKSKLLGEEVTNAAGIDGVTINRFNGQEVCRTSVKAAQSSKGLGTNVSDVLKALKDGTLNPNDTVAGIGGTDEVLKKAIDRNMMKAIQNGDMDFANTLKQAKEQLSVSELNNPERIKQSTQRLQDKMLKGQASAQVTVQEISKKAVQGAVIGAAISLTLSGITNYLKYRNGEITEAEAFQAVGEETLKGALLGSAMAAVTIFLPAGILGFVAGMAVGIYLSKVTTNVLDEIFGKGAYEEILDASGYVYGMTLNLESCLRKLKSDNEKIQSSALKIRVKSAVTERNFDVFDDLMKGKS
ncbi:hypothetical protein MHH52_10395 [Paenibacillus sp. FSL K6-0276]|uniref:hypothetical protein n=1 Tax=Paenibacillus sp. FSL K6-0276 TaxID=2921450 RepID=UPI0030ED2951